MPGLRCRYDLKLDSAILAEAKHLPLYKELVDKYQVRPHWLPLVYRDTPWSSLPDRHAKLHPLYICISLNIHKPPSPASVDPRAVLSASHISRCSTSRAGRRRTPSVWRSG